LWVITIRFFFSFYVSCSFVLHALYFFFSTILGIHLFSLDVYQNCNSNLLLGIIAFKFESFWKSFFPSLVLYLGEFLKMAIAWRPFLYDYFQLEILLVLQLFFCSQRLIIVQNTYLFFKVLVLLLHIFFFKLRWVFGVCIKKCNKLHKNRRRTCGWRYKWIGQPTTNHGETFQWLVFEVLGTNYFH
jgi:hypothetical protein